MNKYQNWLKKHNKLQKQKKIQESIGKRFKEMQKDKLIYLDN